MNLELNKGIQILFTYKLICLLNGFIYVRTNIIVSNLIGEARFRKDSMHMLVYSRKNDVNMFFLR